MGHADLIAAGVVKAGSQGFSIIVKAGQVVTVRAYSAINAASEGFSIGVEKAAAVIDALKAYGAEVWLKPPPPL